MPFLIIPRTNANYLPTIVNMDHVVKIEEIPDRDSIGTLKRQLQITFIVGSTTIKESFREVYSNVPGYDVQNRRLVQFRPGTASHKQLGL